MHLFPVEKILASGEHLWELKHIFNSKLCFLADIACTEVYSHAHVHVYVQYRKSLWMLYILHLQTVCTVWQCNHTRQTMFHSSEVGVTSSWILINVLWILLSALWNTLLWPTAHHDVVSIRDADKSLRWSSSWLTVKAWHGSLTLQLDDSKHTFNHHSMVDLC